MSMDGGARGRGAMPDAEDDVMAGNFWAICSTARTARAARTARRKSSEGPPEEPRNEERGEIAAASDSDSVGGERRQGGRGQGTTPRMRRD